MSLRERMGTVHFRLSNWVADHNSEVLLAGAFAAVFAVAAWFLVLPIPEPYLIYVLADHHTDPYTMNTLLTKAAMSHTMPIRRIDGVPVFIEVDQLSDDSEGTIRTKAAEISLRSDVLLVIGHLPSQLAEAALKVLLETRPQIPFIATVSSDDNLLSQCPGGSSCFADDQFVPLLQLTPTNEVQGQSAVTYATIQGKRRFLIVYDNDKDNAAYATNLVQAYEAGIKNFNQSVKKGDKLAEIAGEYKMDAPPNIAELKAWKSDCILYAGGMGEGLSFLTALGQANLQTMVIFSDSSVQDGFSPRDLKDFPGTLFTNQIDANDFNEHKNVYVEDAFAIAGQLIDDVQRRREDRRLRFKTFAHIQTARDVRRNLNRAMKQNSISHSWYEGSAPESVYAFNKYKRFGGLFHVWQLRSASEKNAHMDDVDHWHVPRPPTEIGGQ